MCIRDRQYIPGKKNTVADALSRVNLEKGTFQIDREDIGKVYCVLTSKEELVDILSRIREEQAKDQKLAQIKERVINNEMKIIPFYQVHQELLFTKTPTKNNQWKLCIPRSLE